MPLRPKKLAIYVFFFVLAFFVLFSRAGSFNPLEFQIVRTVSFPLRLILAPLNELKKLVFYHRIYNEYLNARKESDGLRRRLVSMEELTQENNRLEQLLSFKRKALFTSVAANVIVRDPSNWSSSVMIDKGSGDGIAVGMPVVNALGVVGKVAEVSRGQSKVVLLADPSFSVAALVQRSRDVGLVSGSLRGICRMRYLADTADVKVGDVVVTSKFSSSFPEGLILGQVLEVSPGDEFPQPECLVKPAVNFSQLEEVLVVKAME